MVRQNIGGVRLAEMGVSASRDGSLTLDRTKLTKLLQDKPAALDSFFSDSNGDGLIKSVRGYLDQWLSSTKGVITQRRDSISRTQNDLDKRQIRLEAEYQQVYQRYLGQYSRLQAMQSQMSSTLDSLNNYFAQNQ
jgi:flagellar hook-associated protein 2